MELQKNPGGYDMFLVIDKLKIVKNICRCCQGPTIK